MDRIKKIVNVIETELSKSQLYYFDYDLETVNIPLLESEVRDLRIDTVINNNDHTKEVEDKRETISQAEGYLDNLFPGKLVGTIGGAMDRSNVSMGSVKMKSKNISLDDKYVDEMIVFNDLKSRMIKHGEDTVAQNGLSHHFKIDLSIDYRKNISKLVLGGSLIATEGRIGQATFILMNQRMILHFSPFITTSDNGQMCMNSLDIIIDPTITDKTIIGRVNTKDQPGIKFITNGVKYSIEEIGNKCASQYITLDVIYDTIE